jgi:hypothetical protein
MKIEIESKVLNGKLEKNRDLISEVIQSLEGKDIIITIEKKKKKRSNPQNSFYWSVVLPMMQTGFYNNLGEHVGIQEAHEFLKARFLFREVVNQELGEVIKLSKSTTELSTIEWEEYMDSIRAFSTEFLGIQIPLPNENITYDLK